MFTLQDGREHLYQWDLDRHVIVEDKNIGEVHFCNRTSDCSLVVEVKDGLAAIPNILLQDARPIRVYAYCDDKYTLVEEQFTVKSRTRPADYIYEETETLQYSTVTQRVDAIEANLPSMVVDEVNNYLTENPVEVDFTGYATETYVDTAISNIDIPTVPTNVSGFTNDAGYITIEDVPETDLTGYATESYVDNKAALTRIWVNTQDFATETYVAEAIANAAPPEVDLSDYYTKAQVDRKISDTDNQLRDDIVDELDSYATKTYVTTAITNALNGIATAEEGSY